MTNTMAVHRAVRLRLHPKSIGKHRQMMRTAGACRAVWNYMLGHINNTRDMDFVRDSSGKLVPRPGFAAVAGKVVDKHEQVCKDMQVYYNKKGYPAHSYFSLGKQFTHLRNDPNYAWLKDVSRNIVVTSLKPIETAYKKFFKYPQDGLPRFKSRDKADPSFPIHKAISKVQGDWLKLQRIGWVKLAGDNPYRDTPDKFVWGTVKQEAGKWYAYLVYETEVPDNVAEQAIGIDRNVGQIALSTGDIIRLPDTDRLEARRRRYQRKMARQQSPCRAKKGRAARSASNRYLRTKQMHARTVRKLVQIRTDWCHQTSRQLADKYGMVVLEELNTKGMTASAKGDKEAPGKNVAQKRGLNRSIMASAWGQMARLLEYKTRVEYVPAAYTSQTCSECKVVDAKSRKSQAVFHCTACGHRMNADHNAALNILAAHQHGASASGGGGVTRPVKGEQQLGRHGTDALVA